MRRVKPGSQWPSHSLTRADAAPAIEQHRCVVVTLKPFRLTAPRARIDEVNA